MSVKVLSAVWETSRATKQAFTVLLSLADWADHNGICYPGRAQIMKKARVSKSTAIRALQQLRKIGEIEVVERRHSKDDADEVPSSVWRQARTVYRITLIKPRLAQVVPVAGHLGAAQVVATSDHLRAKQEVSDSDHLSPQSLDPPKLQFDTEVVSNPTAHIRNSPSLDPSVELKAGAPPRRTPEKPSENPADNIGVITKLAHEVLDQLGATHPDLRETLKSRCAHLHVAYDSGVVRAALDSAEWQRRHGRRA